MSSLAPAGPVYQAGTLSGNPIAVAAGLAQLRQCTAEVYQRLDRTATTVATAVKSALDEAGVACRVNTAGNLFSVFFTDTDVSDFTTASTTSVTRYAAFFHAMLDAGVYLPPSAYEAWFVGAAHDEVAVGRIVDALPAAAKAAAQTPSGAKSE
jgi:glutamate-1-semialdehyde 2,1-aminomutase